MPFYTNRGLSLRYLDEGSGPTLLMLHPFPLNAAAFSPQLGQLARKYRMLIPDLSGFGSSELESDITEMDVLAEDALALLDKLHLERSAILGVSMGGYVCMALLRKAPDRCSALVLCDTQPFADDPEAKTKREENAQKTLAEGMPFLARTMIGKLLSANALIKLPQEVTQIILQNPKEGAAAALRGMARRPDSRDVLAKYAGPSMVLVGDQDAITPLDKAQALSASLSSSRLVQIPKAGHLANFENPTVFNAELDHFLTGRTANAG